jgi:hypothetical protein
MITSFQHVRELLQRYVPFLDVDNPQVLGLVIVVFFGGLSFLYVFFQWHRKMSIHWMKKAALARRRYVSTDGVQVFLSSFLPHPKKLCYQCGSAFFTLESSHFILIYKNLVIKTYFMVLVDEL